MKKLLIVMLIFLVTISFVNAGLTLVSPQENQLVSIGEELEFEISSDPGDYEFNIVLVKVKCSGDVFWSEVYEHYTQGYVLAFKDTIDLEGVGKNYCDFKVQVVQSGLGEYKSDSATTVVNIEPKDWIETVVTRNMGGSIYPGGWGKVDLVFSPGEGVSYSGLIVNEFLPSEIMDPTEMGEDPVNTYDPNHLIGISNGNFDWDYVDEENKLKFLLMSSSPLIQNTLYYVIQADQNLEPGTEIIFNGLWDVLGVQGEVGGKQVIVVSGDYVLPECPITDQQILEYVNKWSKKELNIDPGENDNIMMQILEVWKNCE